MLKFKRLIFFILIFIIFLFFYLKSPGENKDILKLNEIVNRINEIEKLIKINRKNFELIKNALLETKLNTNKLNDLKNLKEMLVLLHSQSNIDEDSQNLKWNSNYKICPYLNFTKSNIDMSDMYDKMNFTDINGGVWKQGFNIEYSKDDFVVDKLKVFVIPHSHQDTGWLKTIDEYFNEDTKAILDNMLNFLTKTPKMTFVHAEIVFFVQWWHTLNDEKKTQVQRLLNNKQLELVTGGWVMTDEAAAHYFSILNQLTEGHMWLKSNLKYFPQSGWSIDPFGYSHVMPYILNKSGIDNMVIQRVHYIVKKNLAKNKQLEFRWKQYWDASNQYAIPCHMMPFFSYDVPHTCGPEPAVCCQFDFMRMIKYGCPWHINPVEITDSNVESRAELLLDQYRKKSRLFDNGNVLLVPLGDDFRYKNSKEWEVQYNNYNKLMDYMNSRKDWNVEIKFGTVSDYFSTIKAESLKNLPLLTGDMFAYADLKEYYWTGYYTSRPFLKILDRMLMTNLRTAEIVYSLSLAYDEKYKRNPSNVFDKLLLAEKIDKSRKSLGLNQHHDAITGTSKNLVTIDFEKRLFNAITWTQDIFIRSAQRILQNDVGKSQFDEIIFDVDEVLTSYDKPIKKVLVDMISTNERYVYLFNSLSQPRQAFVFIPIHANSENGISVIGSGNQAIKCQLTPSLSFNEKIDPTKHFVSFSLNIAPLAFEKVRLLVSNDLLTEKNCFSSNIKLFNMENSLGLSKNYKVLHEQSSSSNPFITIENSLFKVYINSQTGLVESIDNSLLKTKHNLNVLFKSYGIQSKPESSGAYLFVPDGDGNIIDTSGPNSFFNIQGKLYDEVFVKTKFITQIIRLYKVDGLLVNALDIDNIIDITQQNNFEISMVIKTDFVEPTDFFYVDANCFQFIRKKNLLKLPVQGNVYPMSCGAYIESQSNYNWHRLSVFSKQANGLRGGKFSEASTKLMADNSNSFLELFQDRIINQDDRRGLEEPLTDNRIVTKKYRLVLESWQQNQKGEKYHTRAGAQDGDNRGLGELTVTGFQLLNDLNYPLHQTYVKANFTNKIPSNFVGQKSLMTGFGFPCDYQMVNLQTIGSGFPKLTIHRLKLNCLAKYIGEGSCKFSMKKSPLLKSMFDDLIVKYVDRFTLTGVESISSHIPPEDINIDLMELETYELHFDF